VDPLSAARYPPVVIVTLAAIAVCRNSEGPRHLADVVSNSSSSSVARITAVHTLLSFPLINFSGVHGRSPVLRMRGASPAPYRSLYNIRSALIEYARVYTRYPAAGSGLARIYFSTEFRIHAVFLDYKCFPLPLATPRRISNSAIGRTRRIARFAGIRLNRHVPPTSLRKIFEICRIEFISDLCPREII